ncbi:hypothetical protein [Staphylococcus delphini]|uniref:hypothetical protein n=1 Tax=Staphylococcus delphini TaxID=53344 RepID=UPI0033650F89
MTSRNKDIMAIIFNIAVIIICGIGIFLFAESLKCLRMGSYNTLICVLEIIDG